MDNQEIEQHPEIKKEQATVTTSTHSVLPDLLSMRTLIANICFSGEPGKERGWVLVDAGVVNFADEIIDVAEERFGATPPQAIIITHGHFDHIGSLKALLHYWDVPVYVHSLEIPYLTGEVDYPPPDPMVGGGLMAEVSFLYPNKGIDLGDRVKPLPEDGSVPGMRDWRWIHTPGHTIGHISLFRDVDRALIAGDAFITVKQESAWAVITQAQEVHGPPSYFTTDWEAARKSVEQLASLKPSVAITGHGLPMSDEELSNGLQKLAQNFDQLAIPDQGRYIQ